MKRSSLWAGAAAAPVGALHLLGALPAVDEAHRYATSTDVLISLMIKGERHENYTVPLVSEWRLVPRLTNC